jgi:hypothetical protein
VRAVQSENGALGELLTREQFDAEVLAIEAQLPLLRKLREQGVPYDKLTQLLKDDLHAHMGVEPVQMFRRVPVTKVADPESAKKFRMWANMPAVAS